VRAMPAAMMRIDAAKARRRPPKKAMKGFI
jgi:hypothetical protein